LQQLFRQYVQYGYWKVRVIRKHHLPASPRQLVPGAFVGGLLALATASPFSNLAWEALLGILALYVTSSIVFSLVVCGERSRRRYLAVMPFVFAAYQFGFGYGFLQGILDFVILRKTGRGKFAALTRTAASSQSR
jgi:hypothetical protein